MCIHTCTYLYVLMCGRHPPSHRLVAPCLPPPPPCAAVPPSGLWTYSQYRSGFGCGRTAPWRPLSFLMAVLAETLHVRAVAPTSGRVREALVRDMLSSVLAACADEGPCNYRPEWKEWGRLLVCRGGHPLPLEVHPQHCARDGARSE